ncbi:MAG TPA: hypothetical protein DCF99_06100 [Flavobacteriaceae bacterium]|nr:hypothetical protein [Flavobacteriaceae bacterium]
MINFKFHIVKMTMLKSHKVVNLFYEMKSGKLLGYGFDTDPVDLPTMLEIMKTYIPPTFTSIGSYSVQFGQRALYEYRNNYTKEEEYKYVQEALKLQ